MEFSILFQPPPLRWGKVWNLFMIFFEHPRDKFALFFDAFCNIWDQGKRGIQNYWVVQKWNGM